MASFDYNPITGQLDLTGSGGASYIDGVVADSSLLPTTLGTPALDSVYLAKAGSGVWLINRRPAGLYCRVANNGVAADWQFLGAFPEVNADGNWALYNSATPSKELKFDLSGISASTVRTLTVPDASGTIATTADFAAPPAIGNTTPNTGAFTTLTANGSGSADLVAEFGTAAAGRNHQIQIWGNNVGRNHIITGSGAAGVSFQMGTGGAHCAASTTNTPTGFRVSSTSAFTWSNAGNAFGGGVDCAIFRDAADTVAQRRDTNPQVFRIYNTFSSTTSFERLNIRWASNELILDAEAGSAGGTLRGIKIGSATSSLLGFYGVTPVDQPATVTDPTGGGTQDAEARTAINAIIDRLQELGLIA